MAPDEQNPPPDPAPGNPPRPALNGPISRHAPQPRQNFYGCLRIFLHVVPGPAILVMGVSFGNLIPNKSLALYAFIAMALVMAIGLGIFDGALSGALARKGDGIDPAALTIHTITFVLLQVLVAPVVMAALLFGACALFSA